VLLPGDVRLGLHATHAPEPLHTGVVPEHWALVVHWVAAHDPSARQKLGVGHVLLPDGVPVGPHATHAPAPSHTGVVPEH
jgi:hypothetical protein